MVKHGLITLAILAATAAVATVTATAAAPSLPHKYMGKRQVDRNYYTLHIPKRSYETAQYISQQLGVRLEGQVGEIDSYYMVSSERKIKKRALSKQDDDDEDIIIARFQKLKSRSLLLKKRDINAEEHWDHVQTIDKQIPKRRVKRGPIPNELLQDMQKSLGINDPWLPQQWHLINQKNVGNDINVTGVWKQGITGKGINIAILDDGLDYKSKDLKDNFFAEGSYDFNDHESLPTPKLWDDNHGTRCAGQIAAVKNDVCGVGIAYESKVAGVRILSGDLTDADEAIALNYEYQKNHIFSCSWGPPDNGETMEAPNGVLAEAFTNGIAKGRGGKGSIFVFATGNGAMSGDNCNFDGYTNSIYTITVGAIDHHNEHPPYSESCSAQLVVTYSSGNGEYIHTTDVGESSCSDRHGGTSAAAPNAVGIFALVLSVRPDLTWRDLQHLCVQTAIPINLEDSDWKTLPSGRLYNHKFGYGKLDAYSLVETAKTFKLVNNQTWLELPSPVKRRAIPDSTGLKTKKALKSTVLVTDEMIKAAGLLRLEHVTATVNIEHQRRGNIVVDLESPKGIKSELATRRNMDASGDGVKNWKFMTVKHWEEDPVGDWTLSVYDVDHADMKGHLLNWTLTLFGELDPEFEEGTTPVHVWEDGIHRDKEHEIVVSTSTKAAQPTTKSDNTPSRPTRIKGAASKSVPLTKTTAFTTMTSPSQSSSAILNESTNIPVTNENDEVVIPEGKGTANPDQEKSGDGYLTIVYGVVGSLAIFGVATTIYVYKRNGWKSASDTNARQNRPDGYEFDVLQPLTELDEDELSESDEDEAGHLVRDTGNNNNIH